MSLCLKMIPLSANLISPKLASCSIGSLEWIWRTDFKRQSNIIGQNCSSVRLNRCISQFEHYLQYCNRMKIQDIIFTLIITSLFAFRKPGSFVYVGLCFLILSIPLFFRWVFFTAERCTWYAAICFFIYCIYTLIYRKDTR